MGFEASYSEVSKFERNTAVMKGTDIDSIHDICLMQHVADTVDHTIRTLKRIVNLSWHGNNCRNNSRQPFKEKSAKISSVHRGDVKIGNLEKVTFSRRGKVLHQTKFEARTEIKSTDPTQIIGDLWKCAWLLVNLKVLYGMVLCR